MNNALELHRAYYDLDPFQVRAFLRAGKHSPHEGIARQNPLADFISVIIFHILYILLRNRKRAILIHALLKSALPGQTQAR